MIINSFFFFKITFEKQETKTLQNPPQPISVHICIVHTFKNKEFKKCTLQKNVTSMSTGQLFQPASSGLLDKQEEENGRKKETGSPA